MAPPIVTNPIKPKSDSELQTIIAGVLNKHLPGGFNLEHHRQDLEWIWPGPVVMQRVFRDIDRQTGTELGEVINFIGGPLQSCREGKLKSHLTAGEVIAEDAAVFYGTPTHLSEYPDYQAIYNRYRTEVPID